MCVATVMKEVRKDAGMSQTDFGRLTGYSKSAISDMERKKADIPEIVIKKTAKRLGSWRLAIEKCQECSTNIFCAPYLDGANDNHIAVLAKLQEELEEATEAIQNIFDMNLINKKKRDDLTEQEMDMLEDYFDQIYDVGPAIQFAILRFAELFELDPERIRLRNEKKLHGNGALTRKNI